MASDRLTQLQEAVNCQAENFCNSIGILQQAAPSSAFPELDKMLAAARAEGSTSPPDSSNPPLNSSNSGKSNGHSKDSQTSSGILPNATNSTTSRTTENSSKSALSNSTGTSGNDAPLSKEDYGVLFARTISRTAKDIDTLIDSLPSTSEYLNDLYTPIGATPAELFANSIRRLEQENVETAEQLEETIKRGEMMLERIQMALAEIAQIQLKSQSLN